MTKAMLRLIIAGVALASVVYADTSKDPLPASQSENLTAGKDATAANLEILTAPSKSAGCITIVGSSEANTAAIVVDTNDDAVVQLAANLFADDVGRVTGRRPLVTNSAASGPQMIIAGTLGRSAFIDGLAKDGKLQDLDKIQGRWEATLWEVVMHPLPGIERALVIVGSDRRGTAYGLMQLSEKIGVSPWNWWADVPLAHHDALAVKIASPQTDAPGVKYRGIFINDEDWGLNPWASKTLDPKFGNIGPKTYAKVFELMLRLRLNYIWPAMHACSAEFASVPENIALADKYGIVAGSSHCEPMLCNNVHWNEKKMGRWNYLINRDTIYSYWEENVKARRGDEAVWTLGIRGIHDAGMEKPPNDVPGRIKLLGEVFHDQRELLNKYVTDKWGPIAQCFVPYKEVLPLYDAGLEVPKDVTLVWVDDNFGYIRRLSNPAERQRPGGAGVYWHMSYYGGPHSYTWIDTTPPALMWEELHKAWENDARTLWVINVGDIKPGEIGIEYFSRLAWSPDSFHLGGQQEFLHDFSAQTFGENFAEPVTDLLMEFYRLGTIRKPELMNREWALSLAPDQARQLERDYRNLLNHERWLARRVPVNTRDAYTELVGFPVRVLGSVGEIFTADRKIQLGRDVAANEGKITTLSNYLELQVKDFSTKVAGGKWDHIMPGLVTGRDLTRWSSQVRWPWGESASEKFVVNTNETTGHWRDAAVANCQTSSGASQWHAVEGLGPSGRAMALLPVNLDASWEIGDTNAPALEYDFTSKGGDAAAFVDFLPTFRIYPGLKLRVAVGVDGGVPIAVEVPGSSGAENENGRVRSDGVQNNYVRAWIPLHDLSAGPHTLVIRALDPGAVVDRILVP